MDYGGIAAVSRLMDGFSSTNINTSGIITKVLV
jgi:hypothetical protein